MNLEGRRETENVLDMRHKRKRRSRAAETLFRLRNLVPSPYEEWDKVADRMNEKYGSGTAHYADEIGEKEIEEIENAARDARHERQAPLEKSDNTRVDPRIARRRGLNGEDLGEYKMKQ